MTEDDLLLLGVLLDRARFIERGVAALSEENIFAADRFCCCCCSCFRCHLGLMADVTFAVLKAPRSSSCSTTALLLLTGVRVAKLAMLFYSCKCVCVCKCVLIIESTGKKFRV